MLALPDLKLPGIPSPPAPPDPELIVECNGIEAYRVGRAAFLMQATEMTRAFVGAQLTAGARIAFARGARHTLTIYWPKGEGETP